MRKSVLNQQITRKNARLHLAEMWEDAFRIARQQGMDKVRRGEILVGTETLTHAECFLERSATSDKRDLIRFMGTEEKMWLDKQYK